MLPEDPRKDLDSKHLIDMLKETNACGNQKVWRYDEGCTIFRATGEAGEMVNDRFLNGKLHVDSEWMLIYVNTS
jgi:hypothetical protein